MPDRPVPDVPQRPRQLAFDLPVDSRHGVEDFLVGASNEAAYGLIERWPAWPEAWLRLTGPEGAGKTHLAAIWARAAHAWTLPAAQIAARWVLPAPSGPTSRSHEAGQPGQLSISP